MKKLLFTLLVLTFMTTGLEAGDRRRWKPRHHHHRPRVVIRYRPPVVIHRYAPVYVPPRVYYDPYYHPYYHPIPHHPHYSLRKRIWLRFLFDF